MKPEEFLQGVLKTESVDFESMIDRLTVSKIRLLHAGIGMATESGEFLDMLKKHIFYGKDLDEINLLEEIGDHLWYIGIALDVLGTSFEEVMRANHEKLATRYRSKFTRGEAVLRDLSAERQSLESKFDTGEK